MKESLYGQWNITKETTFIYGIYLQQAPFVIVNLEHFPFGSVSIHTDKTPSIHCVKSCDRIPNCK